MTVQLKSSLLVCLLAISFCFSCQKKPDPILHFRVKFDPLQERLNANGMPVGVTSGRAAQTPSLNAIGIQQIELATSASTALGKGAVLFSTPSTSIGGETAIDFGQLKFAKDGELFFDIPMSKLNIGRYEWARVAVAYQNFDALFNMTNVPFSGSFNDERGTVATFLGGSNYITQYRVGLKDEIINGNRKQGYWCFESKLTSAYASNDRVYTGQIAEGGTTMVNPMYQTSPIPSGACTVTGRFDTPLSITGKETEDMTITLSFSTNRSFEWEESIARNGKWDADRQAATGQPTIEKVMDVGLRGLRVWYENK
jgi:hypothetical protein